MTEPRLFDFDSHITLPGRDMQTALKHSLKNRLHWRADPDTRIPGGSRRTLVPKPHGLLERALFGASPEFQRMVSTCAQAANLIMQQELEIPDWQTNRIAVNYMPKETGIGTHTDPPAFRDGVIVVGLGSARFTYGNQGQTVETPSWSIMHIPPGLDHSADNLEAERFSIALIDDARIDAGASLASLVFRNRLPTMLQPLYTPEQPFERTA